MSDYTQIVYFGPKDALITGNPLKKITGTQVDAELAAISTAILSKLDSADVASNAEAAALASTSKLLTPAGLLYALDNGVFDTAGGLIVNLTGATPVAGDSLMFYDQSTGNLADCLVSDLLSLVPAGWTPLHVNVYKTVDETLAHNVPEVLNFTAEHIDTGGWHDNVTNNSRLTVPSGVTAVELGAGVAFSLSGASQAQQALQLAILKNGATVVQAIWNDVAADASLDAQDRNIFTGPISCTAGDYFELQVTIVGESSIGCTVSCSAVGTRFWAKKLA
jgi:hypothetical protein